MVRTSFFLTGIQLEQLNQLAQHTGMSVSDHLRRAVDRYLLQPDQRGYYPFVSGTAQLIQELM